MTNREVFVLGWLYGTIAKEVPEFVQPVDVASRKPIAAIAELVLKLEISGKLTKLIHRKIVFTSKEVDLLTKDMNDCLDFVLQKEWLLGFFSGRAGELFPTLVNNPDNHVKQLRKENGLTQHQLAEALGVSQSVLSRVESGNEKLYLKYKDKIEEILKK